MSIPYKLAGLALAVLAASPSAQTDTLPPPTGLTIDSTGRLYTLHWTAAANENRGFLIFGDTLSQPDTLIENLNAGRRSIVLGTVPSGRTYHVRMKTYEFSTKRESAFSEEVSFVGRPYFSRLKLGLHQYLYGMLRWVDTDMDGDLDLLIAGNRIRVSDPTLALGSALYRNTGGKLEPVDLELPRLYANGALEFGDFDNDGDPDLVMVGCCRESKDIARLFRNDAGIFVPTEDTLQAGQMASASWGDYDNDGDLDLLLSSMSESRRNTRIYRNDSGSFTDSKIVFPVGGLSWGSASFLDLENDGDLDIVGVAMSPQGSASGTYLNDNRGAFTLRDTLNARFASTSWTDQDGDGDLDGLLGDKLYRNDGGKLVPTRHAFNSEASTWMDINYDGKMDVAAGNTLYLGSDTGFSPVKAPFTLRLPSGYCWGDFDGDGDLDLAYTETDRVEDLEATSLYANNGHLSGSPAMKRSASHRRPWTPDAVPTSLEARIDGNSVTFSWLPPADPAFLDLSLTYALAVGSSRNAVDVLSPMADLAMGNRYIPSHGNVFMNRSWTLRGLKPGRYHWTVQSINQDLEGSRFAASMEFEMAATRIQNASHAGPVSLTWIRRGENLEFALVLVARSDVNLTLHAPDGRTLRHWSKEDLAPGTHSARVKNPREPGIKLYRLTTGTAALSGILPP